MESNPKIHNLHYVRLQTEEPNNNLCFKLLKIVMSVNIKLVLLPECNGDCCFISIQVVFFGDVKAGKDLI